MALTDEQRSMLQLLLGGQSYDDIASLLGVGPDEVHSRARGALTAIGGADPDAQVAISDYILGQADPIGRADAVRHLQSDPGANALAASLIAQLRLLAPQAQLPEIPAPRGGPAAAPAAPPTVPTPPSGPPGAPPVPAQATPPSQPSGPSLPSRVAGAMRGSGSSKRRAQLAIGLGALGLLLVVGVLAIAGVFDGDGDSGDGETEAAASDELTLVELAPLQGGSGAAGQAVFAQTGDQPLLQVNLSGLPQAKKGETYIVWLFNSDSAAFPLARDKVNQQGNLTGAAAIPQQLLPLLPQFGCIDVSLASTQETQAALQQAVQGETLPAHSGQSVLRGQIPAGPGEAAPAGPDSDCQGEPPAEGATDGGVPEGADPGAVDPGAVDPGAGEGALGQ